MLHFVIRLILARRFVSALTFFTLQSILYLKLQEHITPTQIVAAFSVMIFSSKFFSIFAGMIGDRYGVTNTMLLGCFLDVIAYFILVNTYSYNMLLLSFLFFGLGSSFFFTNARALLLELGGNNYPLKTKLQGYFQKAGAAAILIAPAFSYTCIAQREIHFTVKIFFIIEVIMFAIVAFSLRSVRQQCSKARNGNKMPFNWQDLKTALTRPKFLLLHLIFFIPEGITSATYTLIPYYFSTVLNMDAAIPLSVFMLGLISVLGQDHFSRILNYPLRTLALLSLMVTAALIGVWFIALANPSDNMGYVYVILFGFSTLFTQTAVNNGLVRLDTGSNRGATYGTSRVIFSATTAMVMNILPIVFLV